MTLVDKTPSIMNIIEQIHRSLPQTMTPENLADWITKNQKQVINHVTKTPLTPKEIAEYEHKSSAASRALDRLKEVEDSFKHYLKKGTPPDPNDSEKHQPIDITIPPTKGQDALKANRQFADDILEKGYTEDITDVYIIPYPEEQFMVAVTIKGFECPDYTKPMSDAERQLYGKLFIKEGEEMRKLDDADLDVRGDGTARIKTKGKGRQAFI